VRRTRFLAGYARQGKHITLKEFPFLTTDGFSSTTTTDQFVCRDERNKTASVFDRRCLNAVAAMHRAEVRKRALVCGIPSQKAVARWCPDLHPPDQGPPQRGRAATRLDGRSMGPASHRIFRCQSQDDMSSAFRRIQWPRESTARSDSSYRCCLRSESDEGSVLLSVAALFNSKKDGSSRRLIDPAVRRQHCHFSGVLTLTSKTVDDMS
jgi:hypothetical protein